MSKNRERPESVIGSLATVFRCELVVARAEDFVEISTETSLLEVADAFSGHSAEWMVIDDE